MKKQIKGEKGNAEKLGIAKQVAGIVVEVERHPKFTQLWQFEAFGEKWMASDYAFEEE